MDILSRACWILTAFLALHSSMPASGGGASTHSHYLAYIGTYTGAKSKGIYAYEFDAGTGKFTPLGLAAESVNPSFLIVHPSRRFLYAVNEIGNYRGGKSGGVSAFALNRKTGKLTFLNEVASQGADPCYVALDKTGRFVLVANYSSGSIAVFPVSQDGRLGQASAVIQHQGSSVDRQRQEGPHAHAIEASPDNRYLLAADLGLDRVLVYRFDGNRGLLQANDPAFATVPPGAGPRHLAFHPSGHFVYVINEMGSSVSVFYYNTSRGSLRELQTISALPKDFAGHREAAEIEVHPSGQFLYASNRGQDSIAVFAIDAGKGTLTHLENVPTGGKTPRNFAIDPTGSYLIVANQDSDKLAVFRIDPFNGRLTPSGQMANVPSPVCVTFVSAE